jgi:hypothetical protein
VRPLRGHRAFRSNPAYAGYGSDVPRAGTRSGYLGATWGLPGSYSGARLGTGYAAWSIASLLRRDFGALERQRFARALDLLDENERYPSLRVHPLEGTEPEFWSASASDALRITFRRLPAGRKLLARTHR